MDRPGQEPAEPMVWRKIWNEWNLRAMVLFTLGVQTVLLFLGNRRKSSHKVWLRVLVWCAYLTSDSVATVALGVLSSKLGKVKEDSGKLDGHTRLVALWAPLLLLLMGGPDTITAYSLEDNSLWLRHLLSLGVQAVAAAYVLIMTWTWIISSPYYDTIVVIHLFPLVLSFVMILVGLIKYGERTWALWLASKDKLRESMLTPPDPSPNYARFMEEYSLKQAEGYHVMADEIIEDQIPAGPYARGYLSNTTDAQDTQCENTVPLAVKAFDLLQIVKRLFVDLILSSDDRHLSQLIFKTISWDDAFQLIAIELGFMYDLLYTKAMLFYRVRGLGRRFISFSLTLLLLALLVLLFSFLKDDVVCYTNCYSIKERIAMSSVDLCITFALLAMIIVFEIYSILILLSSDWTDMWLSVHCKSCALRSAVTCVQLLKQPRWSDSLAQFSLLRFSINENPLVCQGILRRLNIKEKLDKYRYTTFRKIPPNLKKEIFDHVKEKLKLEKPVDASHIRRILSDYGHLDEMWSLEVEFDQIILTWHIATELCYYSDKLDESTYSDKLDESTFTDYRQSMLLSRYMFYLLVMYPFTLPNGIGQIRIRDTFAEAIKFFKEHPIKEQANSSTVPDVSCTVSGNPSRKRTNKAFHRSHKALQSACKMLLEVNTEVPPTKVKGSRSKSVLFDGCRLATALNKQVDITRKWEMIWKLWAEILLYAASQSKGDCHAHQLRRGGELLTHVWLLLVHFGLTDHFQMTQGHAIAKLILR